MLTRAFALSVVVGLASVAQAGAVLDLVVPDSANPLNAAGVYDPGETVTVALRLGQAGGDERLLRLVHLHFDNTDGALGMGAFDWLSDDATHYQDESPGPASAGDPAGVASAYYYESDTDLGPNPARQLTLPAGGDVLVATLEVTMPEFAGVYVLDALSAASSVSFGFEIPLDPTFVTFLRPGNPPPDDLTGGDFSFTVAAVASVASWESMATHAGVGEVGLAIPSAGVFSEPRAPGIGKIVVTFSGAIDPATAIEGNIAVDGCDANGTPLVLGAPAIALSGGDTVMTLSFAPALPDFAEYSISLNGFTTGGGTAIAGNTSRCILGLLGDASGDGVVDNSDLVGVRFFRGAVFDASNVFHVRSDPNTDGVIDNGDLVGVRFFRGNDARNIGCPCP